MNYSQNNEQEVILNYFKEMTNCSFIDIGANDGKTLSNTFALMEAGWNGVYVEASPRAYLKLKGTVPERRGLYFYNCALGITNSKAKFFESDSHLNLGDVGLVSSLLEKEVVRWRPTTQYTEVEVDCYRWKTFLNRLMIKDFDFISIDIEGMDYEVLSQMDLTTTKMVCAEFNGNPVEKARFTGLCADFKLIYESPENLIFAR